MRGILFAVFAAVSCCMFTGCESIGRASGPDPATAIHSDVAGYWLTTQPSKSDILPPAPVAPVQAPATATPPAKPAPLLLPTTPRAKVSAMPNVIPVNFNSSMPICNGPDCIDCAKECGPNCPAGQCNAASNAGSCASGNCGSRATTWQRTRQRVESSAPRTLRARGLFPRIRARLN